MSVRHFLFFIILLSFKCLQAQQYTTTAYRGESGLPNTFTKSVAFDTVGYLWITTDNYMARFDGYKFRHYNKGLPSFYVKSVYRMRNGDMMVLSDMGLSQINYTRDTAFFTTLVEGSADVKDTSDNHIVYPKTMMEDKRGRLWISESYAISYYYQGKLKRFIFPESERTQSYYRSFSLAEFDDGLIVAFSIHGNGYLFNETAQRFEPIQRQKKLPGVSCLLYTGQRSFLAGTSAGVVQFVLDAQNAVQLQQMIVKDVYPSAIVKESPNSFLVSTWTKGIYRMTRDNDQYRLAKIATPVNGIINMVRTADNQVWCNADDGLYLLEPTTFIPNAPKTPDVYIQGSVFESNRTLSFRGNIIYQTSYNNQQFTTQQIWKHASGSNIIHVASQYGQFMYSTNQCELVITDFGQQYNVIRLRNNYPFGEPFHITPDNKGNWWINQRITKGIVRVTPQQTEMVYDQTKGISNYTFTSVVHTDGKLYVLGSGANTYIYRYDEQSDMFDNISRAIPFEHDSTFSVYDAKSGTDGSIYMGTSNGVVRFTDTSITRINLDNYTNYVVSALAVEADGDLWVAVKDGLLHCTRGNILLFKERHGLASNTISFRSLSIDNQNQLWAATSAGLSFSANPDPEYTPVPEFLTVTVNDARQFDAQQVIQNSYAKLMFACYTYPTESIMYQTRILERDTVWSAPSFRTELIIPQMTVGKYTVQVRARKDGNFLWSSPASYSFTVVQAWYFRWWAYILYVLLLTAFIGLVVWLYVRRLQYQKQALETMVKARTLTLEQQTTTLKQLNAMLNEKTEEVQAKTEELAEKNDQLTSFNDILYQKNQELQDTLIQVDAQKHEITTKSHLLQLQHREMKQINKDLETKNQELEATLQNLKKTQAQLVQSEKMASLGVLTAGIAHEINNPINFIGGNVNPLQRDFEELLQILTLYQQQQYDKARQAEQNIDVVFLVQEIQQLIQGIKIGAQRTAEIVKGLRMFSRMDEAAIKSTNVHESIEATLLMLQSQYRDRIIVTKNFDPRITNIDCFPSKLNQVFVNVINNAIQAIEDSGEITITTRLNDNETVTVSVRDTGIGIAPNVIGRIFEPFFTTKDVGKGTGLGLSIALGIIEEHKGSITVTSTEGEGSEFVITLPMKQ